MRLQTKQGNMRLAKREHEATNKYCWKKGLFETFMKSYNLNTPRENYKIGVGDIGTACDGHLVFVACCSVLSG